MSVPRSGLKLSLLSYENLVLYQQHVHVPWSISMFIICLVPLTGQDEPNPAL